MDARSTTSDAPGGDCGDAPRVVAWLADFADFIKLSGLFPSNNVRVRAAGSKVTGEIAELCDSERGLRIDCDAEGLLVTGSRVHLERANLTWLASALRSTAVASLRIAASTSNDSLLTFAAKLRRNVRTARQATTFAAMWSEPIPGIEVLEKTFAISHPQWSHLDHEVRQLLEEDSSRGARLRELVDLSGPVADQLQALENTSGTTTSASDLVSSGGVDLLRRILDVMPPEHLEDPAACLRTVRSVLESGLETLNATTTFRATQEDAKFERVVIGVSSRFFVRPDGRSDESPGAGSDGERSVDGPPAASRGHAGDEQFGEDVAAFRDEFAKLPDAEPDASNEALDSPCEQLAVCLHRLDQVASPAGAARLEHHLSSALQRVDTAAARTMLAPFVASLATPEESADPWRRISLLGPVLERTGLLGSLLATGRIDSDTIVRWFPTGFGSYLDAIEADPIGLAELETTCAALGAQRIVRAGAQLTVGDSAVIESRWNKLFATRSPLVVPFALVRFEHRTDADTLQVAEWLARVKLSDAASAALRIVEPRLLPRAYVQGICELHCSHARVVERRKALEKNSEALIRAYIENPPIGADEARIARAVAALQLYWSPRVEEFVRGLARNGGFLGLRKGPKLVREAASELLRRQAGGRR